MNSIPVPHPHSHTRLTPAILWLTTAAILLVRVSSSSIVAAEDETPPNVVLLFADDLGYGDLACYGHPYAQTPNLDRLAAEGSRFTQFYVTGTTCNPSRTGLMTGRFPARFPKYAADFGFGDQPAITELLHSRGYATGHFGKWHIGPETADGTYGIETIQVIGKSRSPEAGRDDDLYTSAIAFIHENRDRPFYVNVWGHATHFPVNAPKAHAAEFHDVTTRREDFAPTMAHKFDECERIGGNIDASMRQYLADVKQIDSNVGRVLRALESLELEERTIVVFSSDHGPAPVILKNKGAREFSHNMLGYAGELRGGKHTQYEGGLRVPFIIRWPGHVPAGRVDTENVGSFIDWLPTLSKIAGISELPAGLDGEDISDLWFGETRPRRSPLFWKPSAAAASPSMRLGSWKLHLGNRGDPMPELYDLSRDPSEQHNLFHARGDVLQDLSDRLKTWDQSLPRGYVKRR